MPTISYDGNYECWEDAIADSKGYQDMEILNKATQSFEKILLGKYKCERDTFLFDKFQYSLPLLVGLNLVQKKFRKFAYSISVVLLLVPISGTLISCNSLI